jgi:hypothetical protein
MGVALLPVSSKEERELAAKLPRGRIFGTGKAFLPFIKKPLYDELQAAALKNGAPSALPPPRHARARDLNAAVGNAAGQPSDWSAIAVGSIVLAAVAPKRFEWAECVVIAVEGDDLSLRYCDWPDEPTFVRRRTEVALMHPTYQPEPPLEPTA